MPTESLLVSVCVVAMFVVFGAVLAGQIRPAINQRFPLERAADAHRALEARETTGATLLIP